MGYYTVKMAARVGDAGHVYAVEPNPRLQGFIRDSLNINGFWTRFTIVKAAAGARRGQSTLTFDPAMPGGGTVGLPQEGVSEGQTRLTVPIVSLDDVVAADRPVSLIKIDVEGFEPLVITGMQGIMRRSPDAAVVIEVSFGAWQAHGDPAEILTGLAGDRRIFRIHIDGGLEEVRPEALTAVLDPKFVSYVLLLPRTTGRWEQVRHLVRGEGAPAGAAPASIAAPPRPSLLSRIRRRLAALIAP